MAWFGDTQGQGETKEVLSRSIMKAASERTHDGRAWRETALVARGSCWPWTQIERGLDSSGIDANQGELRWLKKE